LYLEEDRLWIGYDLCGIVINRRMVGENLLNLFMYEGSPGNMFNDLVFLVISNNCKFNDKFGKQIDIIIIYCILQPF